MLTPTRGFSLDALASAANPSSVNRNNFNNPNTSSFAQQLAESLEGYLSQSSAGSHVEIDILPQQSGNSSTRQFVVTVTDSTPITPAAKPSPTPIAAPMDMSGMMMYSGIPEDTPTPPPVENPITNVVDAYWASQPEEVRILRTIDDAQERGEMGLKLANQGFAIDPCIMIHRWDPYMTMKIRKAEGYTWVPSVGQNGIPVSPGLTFPTLPSYDPTRPPPGSVLVSTDFAIGLEHTSPANWLVQNHAATS